MGVCCCVFAVAYPWPPRCCLLVVGCCRSCVVVCSCLSFVGCHLLFDVACPLSVAVCRVVLVC